MAELIYDNLAFFETYTPDPSADAFERHMHGFYELYCFLQGDADYIVGDTLYRLKPRDLLFIRPSVYHCLKLKSDSPYRRIVINFDGARLSREMLPVLSDLQTHYTVPADSAIAFYCGQATSTVRSMEKQTATRCVIDLIELILAELKHNDAYAACDGANSIHPLFAKIIAYIDQNVREPMSLNTIAKEFFVSPSWVAHAFRKFLNIGTTEYINRKKILYAQKLISDGTPPMAAAESCGYKNYSTFYIQYKNILGVSPAHTKNAR